MLIHCTVLHLICNRYTHVVLKYNFLRNKMYIRIIVCRGKIFKWVEQEIALNCFHFLTLTCIYMHTFALLHKKISVLCNIQQCILPENISLVEIISRQTWTSQLQTSRLGCILCVDEADKGEWHTATLPPSGRNS